MPQLRIRLPDEPHHLSAVQSDSERTANSPLPRARWSRYRLVRVARLGAWGSAAVAIGLSVPTLLDPCRWLATALMPVWLATGALGFVSLIVRAAVTTSRCESSAAVAVVVLGAGPNVLLHTALMFGASSTCWLHHSYPAGWHDVVWCCTHRSGWRDRPVELFDQLCWVCSAVPVPDPADHGVGLAAFWLRHGVSFCDGVLLSESGCSPQKGHCCKGFRMKLRHGKA
jgi:hypothetical protein